MDKILPCMLICEYDLCECFFHTHTHTHQMNTHTHKKTYMQSKLKKNQYKLTPFFFKGFHKMQTNRN